MFCFRTLSGNSWMLDPLPPLVPYLFLRSARHTHCHDNTLGRETQRNTNRIVMSIRSIWSMHVTSQEHHHWRLLDWFHRLKQIVCLSVQSVCVYAYVNIDLCSLCFLQCKEKIPNVDEKRWWKMMKEDEKGKDVVDALWTAVQTYALISWTVKGNFNSRSHYKVLL